MSKSDLPPVPPASRSHGEAADVLEDAKSSAVKNRADLGRTNFKEQGQTGNTKVNTTNQGYQQDR